MFAYCCNNPTNRLDSTGYFWQELWEAFKQAFNEATQFAAPAYGIAGVISQADSPAPGPGDIAGLIVAAGTALVCATYAVVSSIVVVSYSKKETAEDSLAITIPKKEQNYQYWEAVRIRNQVFIGRGLSFFEACIRVACGGDVMCANQDAARWILVANLYTNAVGPEIHGSSGYYWHYHPNRNSHTHIWYL